jgi:hypothetical protein
MSRVLRIVCATALVALVGSCGDGGGTTAKERPSSTAKVTIVEPRAGDVITSKNLTVKLDLDGGKIVNVVDQDLTPDEGHVHVSVDGKILTQTFGLEQKLKAPKDGRHLLQAEFVARDHGPFDPRVLSTVTFEVAPAGAGAR